MDTLENVNDNIYGGHWIVKQVNWGIMTVDPLFCKVEDCIESCQIWVLKMGKNIWWL